MKARLLILTVAILGGFYFVTTHTLNTSAGRGWFTRAASTCLLVEFRAIAGRNGYHGRPCGAGSVAQ